MELFKERVKELFLYPVAFVVSMSIIAIIVMVIMAPFIIIDYFFEGVGALIFVVTLVMLALCKFLYWLIYEPFFKKGVRRID